MSLSLSLLLSLFVTVTVTVIFYFHCPLSLSPSLSPSFWRSHCHVLSVSLSLSLSLFAIVFVIIRDLTRPLITVMQAGYNGAVIRDDEGLTLRKSVSLSLSSPLSFPPPLSPYLCNPPPPPPNHHHPLSFPLVFVCFGLFPFYGGQLNSSINLEKKNYMIKIHRCEALGMKKKKEVIMNKNLNK